MSNVSGFIPVGIFSLGIALALVIADPRSRIGQLISLVFMTIAVITIALECRLNGYPEPFPFFWTYLETICEAIGAAAALEAVIRIVRTGKGATVDAKAHVPVAFFILYGILGVLQPQWRNEAFIDARLADAVHRLGFYLFFGPLALGTITGLIPLTNAIFRAEFDAPEQVRGAGLTGALPFYVAFFFVPHHWQPFVAAIGESVYLCAEMRYRIMEGRRAQFLSRFVSPEVARVIGTQGPLNAMQKTRVILSAVNCDLRGFTAFSETAAPEEVAELLESYYGAISDAVAEFGATIKDFAGDGILVLVGAPIAHLDHADRALKMSLRIRQRATDLLAHWRQAGVDIGLGVGVASGYVTVGAIGGIQRLEYVAVGQAVNLAHRLCDHASSGSILVDARTMSLAHSNNALRFEALPPAQLKGFSREVKIFALAADSAAAAVS